MVMKFQEWQMSQNKTNDYPFSGGFFTGGRSQNQDDTDLPSTILSDADHIAVRQWDAINGMTILSQYLDGTYIDANGVEQPVAPLFVDFANGDMTLGDLQSKIVGLRDEDGNLEVGAEWYDEFMQTAEQQINAAVGISGGGAGGPTTAEQIDSVFAVIRDRSLQMGLSYTDEQLIDIATVAVNGDWNDVQVVDRLLNNYDYGRITEGTITAVADSIKNVYSQYLLDIDDQSAMSMAQKIAIGEQTTEGVVSSVRKLAANQFQWAQPYLDDGLTIVDALAPLRTAVASTLELDPQEIDLNNEKFFDMMFVNDENGQRLATSSEVRRSARSLPEWANTDTARTAASQVASSIGNIFGRRGF